MDTTTEKAIEKNKQEAVTSAETKNESAKVQKSGTIHPPESSETVFLLQTLSISPNRIDRSISTQEQSFPVTTQELLTTNNATALQNKMSSKQNCTNTSNPMIINTRSSTQSIQNVPTSQQHQLPALNYNNNAINANEINNQSTARYLGQNNNNNNNNAQLGNSQEDMMDYQESEFTDELAYLTEKIHFHETPSQFMPYIM